MYYHLDKDLHFADFRMHGVATLHSLIAKEMYVCVTECACVLGGGVENILTVIVFRDSATGNVYVYHTSIDGLQVEFCL